MGCSWVKWYVRRAAPARGFACQIGWESGVGLRVLIVVSALTLAGCGVLPEREAPVDAEGEVRTGVTADVLVRPQARPNEEVPSPQAAEASPAPDVSVGTLGRTVASLGDASQSGLWLKTPLVQQERSGRVFYPETGKSVAVTLIPIEGPVTAGSRLSLQAMQELGAPLTGLPTVDVFGA